MTQSGRECHAKGGIVHEQQWLVAALFGLRALPLTVLEIMVHEVCVPFDGADG